MILIVNVGHRQTDDDECAYEVRADEIILATFLHRNRDGLAECVIKAGQAIRDQLETNEATRVVDDTYRAVSQKGTKR